MIALVFLSILQNVTTGAFIAACVDSSTLPRYWPEALLLVVSNLAFVFYLASESKDNSGIPETQATANAQAPTAAIV